MLTVPCEKSKFVSFASAIVKKIIAYSARSRFPAKLIRCIAFGYSPATYQLCNHPLDLLQFFECYHMYLYYFYLADQKSFFPSIIML